MCVCVCACVCGVCMCVWCVHGEYELKYVLKCGGWVGGCVICIWLVGWLEGALYLELPHQF